MAENILKLKIDSNEYEGKIRRAAQGLQALDANLKKAGKSFADADKESIDFVKELGRMETVSKNTKGKIGEMSAAFTELKVRYKNMTDAEKQSPFGRELAKSLDQLKTRINQTKTDLQSVQSELGGGVMGKMGGMGGSLTGGLGDLSSALSQVGGQMGINTTLVSGLTAGTLGLGAAVAAVAAAEYEAAQAFKAYNEELARQDQITSVTTGLKGTEADNMTAAARSIAKVYGVDFREVINAANTLMTQFGRTGDQAIELIRDGMQGMIMGDGPKMLNMIQQFAPAFRDAGVSADQLVAVIHNSEGGLFSEQNMNAILMGIKNIRLMTKNTSEALAGLGINGEEMSQKMSDGTMTVFEALQKVSEAVENAKAGSKEAGEVMQYVFGRQGAVQGMKLGRAIAELNTNLEETKQQTGEVGESFRRLELANEELEKAMQKTFQVKGWEEMSNFFETVFIKSLASVIDTIGDINAAIDSAGNAATDVLKSIMDYAGMSNDAFAEAFGTMIQLATDLAVALTSPLGLIKEMVKYTKLLTGAGREDVRKQNINEIADTYKKQFDEAENKTVAYNEIHAKILRAANREYNKNGKSDNYERLKEILQIVDDYMMDNLSGLGNQTKAIITPNKKNGKEKDIFKDLFPDVDQSYEESKTYGEQMIQGFNEGLSSQMEATDKNMLKNFMQVLFTTGMTGIDLPVNEIMEAIKEGMDIPDEYWRDLETQINDQLKRMHLDPIQIDLTTGNITQKNGKSTYKETKEEKKQTKYLSDGISKLTSGISGMASGFEALGIDLGKDFKDVISGIQGITSILTAISTIVSAIEVIAGADAFIPFARGGIVPHAAGGYIIPGNDYSDHTPILAQSGEIILNRAQQGVLANQLQGGGLGGMHIVGELQGEKIILVANRTFKRKGQGEIVTWK